MYNLNVNLAQAAASAANTLLAEGSCNTPRTPEILNSIVAMTNPLDYTFSDDLTKRISFGSGGLTNMSSDSNSSSSSQVESPTTNPPSVERTCSQLIKAGLKLSIEQKRKHQGDGDDLLDLDKVKRIKRTESESEDDKIKQENGLTPEDEERRRRRRERNKIAATKCRLKKRERTANLVNESEILEKQNVDFKNQLKELEEQRNTLQALLNHHRPQCQHNIGPATRDALYRLPPVSSVMDQHSYSRPSSVDPSYRNQNYETYSRPQSVNVSNNMTYTRSNITYTKTPNIIVEEVNDYDSHFTNLDDLTSFNYNNQCHNYNGNQSYSSSGVNGCMA